VAKSPNFNFIGNIKIGDEPGSLPLTTIAPHYDALLFAYGASKDKKLGIPGEDSLKGIYSARAFVGWYNGLPEYADLNPIIPGGTEAVVLGQGNVALDVARILLSDVDRLRSTDISEETLEWLSRSPIKKVSVVGRRGPMQAAFTIKELRELMQLPGVAFKETSRDLVPPDLKKLDRAPRRLMEVLVKGSKTAEEEAVKQWQLDFRLSPVSFHGGASNSDTLGAVSYTQMVLDDLHNPKSRVHPDDTAELVTRDAQMAFRSIGYKSEVLPGMDALGIPFNDKLGIIRNDEEGRILTSLDADQGRKHVPGMYAAGWVKRGPTGVIASTMSDAFLTADRIVEDWSQNVPFIGNKDSIKGGWEGIKAEAENRGCRRISWEDWKKIDRAEIERGEARGKKREKFRRVEEMLKVLE
jgi:adrenodoxin-NADP+ reductase